VKGWYHGEKDSLKIVIRPVKLGDKFRVWLNVVILKGVGFGEEAVLAAGSVVILARSSLDDRNRQGIFKRYRLNSDRTDTNMHGHIPVTGVNGFVGRKEEFVSWWMRYAR
jgi:hypothetical protein